MKGKDDPPKRNDPPKSTNQGQDKQQPKGQSTSHRQVAYVSQQQQPQNSSAQPSLVTVALNDRLYVNARTVFEQKSPSLMSKYSEQFVEDVLNHTSHTVTSYNIQKQGANEMGYFFQGYPSGNYLKQVCVIMSLWKQMNTFPIQFKQLAGLSDSDETEKYLETLNKQTPQVLNVFIELQGVSSYAGGYRSPRALQKELLEFFVSLAPIGFLMCLGVRKTQGSQDQLLLPDKKNLIDNFTRLYTIQTEEEQRRNPKNPSILTVGARAMQKHSHRSSEQYWGEHNGLTEKQRNENSLRIMNKLLDQCIWINIHTFNQKCVQIILEVRDTKGYGGRWTIECEFRGLVEPQIEGGHAKKWIH